jgi:hypothetical protein
MVGFFHWRFVYGWMHVVDGMPFVDGMRRWMWDAEPVDAIPGTWDCIHKWLIYPRVYESESLPKLREPKTISTHRLTAQLENSLKFAICEPCGPGSGGSDRWIQLHCWFVQGTWWLLAIPSTLANFPGRNRGPEQDAVRLRSQRYCGRCQGIDRSVAIGFSLFG